MHRLTKAKFRVPTASSGEAGLAVDGEQRATDDAHMKAELDFAKIVVRATDEGDIGMIDLE